MEWSEVVKERQNTLFNIIISDNLTINIWLSNDGGFTALFQPIHAVLRVPVPGSGVGVTSVCDQLYVSVTTFVTFCDL